MLKDLILATRTYRKYDQSYEVKVEELKALIDQARFSNSATNTQPLKYKIVCEKTLVEQIFGITIWGRRYKNYSGPAQGERATGYIAVCCDTTIKAAASVGIDVGIVSELIALGAWEAGLGSCMIGSFAKDKCKEILSLPENIEPMLLIAFGKPNDTIVLEEITEGESTDYYRDENGVHHVPKRKLEDILL